MFFHGTLLHNLNFGVKDDVFDWQITRVDAICNAIGMDPEIINLIHSKHELNWGSVFSHSERQLLSLARGFVANPEVLCMNKPTMAFNERVSREVLQAMKSFVRDRGLALDPD